jgi:radical SAM protein (TIGR01212 family)
MVSPGERYRKLNTVLRNAFGEKVYRIGLCGGFTCPNRDGSKGRGGCAYCNPASSQPINYEPWMPLSRQLSEGVEYIRWRHGARKFIAFFEDYTTTYSDPGSLEAMYREALSFPGVVGLALSTRPDCLSDGILGLLERIAGETFLWVEVGVQSAHDRTLDRVNRCHTVEESRQAIARLHERDIAVSAHVILGLPGESETDMMETARFLTESEVHGVKIHNLHVVEHTALADMVRRGEYEPPALAEYVDLTVRFLERLPPTVVIQRMTGEAPRRLTVAPQWSVNKLAVHRAIEEELENRNTWQGRELGAPIEELRTPVPLPGMPREGAVRNRPPTPCSPGSGS